MVVDVTLNQTRKLLELFHRNAALESLEGADVGTFYHILGRFACICESSFLLLFRRYVRTEGIIVSTLFALVTLHFPFDGALTRPLSLKCWTACLNMHGSPIAANFSIALLIHAVLEIISGLFGKIKVASCGSFSHHSKLCHFLPAYSIASSTQL